MAKYTNKDGKIRFYDGTTPTPYYFELCLDNGDLSAPVGVMKNEEILVLDRGLVDDCAHYIIGNDAPVMEPLSVTFTAMINDSTKFLEFLNLIEGGDVNGNTTVTTKGTTIRKTAALDFFDTTKKCFNVEYKMGVTPGFTNTITYKLNECYFSLNEQTFAEAEDGINLSISGQCYGSIVRAADFTSGTDILA
jgi:hypothetical protein